GRLEEAVQSFTLALTIEPGNLDTLHNRAVAQALRGEYRAALQDYDALLARRPEHAPERVAELIGRGAALVGLGRHVEALAPLERAVMLAPNDAQAHVQRGVALQRL